MADDGFIKRSSSEQAEDNAERARKPGGSNEQAAAVSLTGHTGEQEVVTDAETGQVVGAHTTNVVTDPEAENAVQVPDPDVHPNANATKANALGVHAEPSPNEVAENEDSKSSKPKSSKPKSDED